MVGQLAGGSKKYFCLGMNNCGLVEKEDTGARDRPIQVGWSTTQLASLVKSFKTKSKIKKRNTAPMNTDNTVNEMCSIVLLLIVILMKIVFILVLNLLLRLAFIHVVVGSISFPYLGSQKFT